jgi:uncharacterized NAD-dependent epimerase/dehydratase family protein
MLNANAKLALYAQNAFDGPFAKMAYGVLRYSPNQVVAVIDADHAGRDANEFGPWRSAPIVDSVAAAKALGADTLVLGIAPLGGVIPPTWYADLDLAASAGMAIINGLHDKLAPRYPGTVVWDIRTEPTGLPNGTGQAGLLDNRRVLMVGTDMAVGKMTAGLEIWKALPDAGFVATGQIGMTILGSGVPLDAIRLDFASGAIEREVMRYQDRPVVVIEGQGSIIHPSSSATLPLIRGSVPTHLILCVRAGQTHLRSVPDIAIPSLTQLIALYESIGSAVGTYLRPRTVGVAVNTVHLDDGAARVACDEIARETGLPAVDPIRHGAETLAAAVLA